VRKSIASTCQSAADVPTNGTIASGAPRRCSAHETSDSDRISLRPLPRAGGRRHDQSCPDRLAATDHL
jgi:hypothetical protein